VQRAQTGAGVTARDGPAHAGLLEPRFHHAFAGPLHGARADGALPGEERWGFAFYAYSSERYELSVVPSGEFFGPPEEAFRVSAEAYLR
jgi:hypothetical protein